MARPAEQRLSLAASAGVGLLAGVAAGSLALVMIALPLFFLARAVEPDGGTGRPLIHTGLTAVAAPAALVVGVVVGVLVGMWCRRGGPLRLRDEDGNVRR